MGTPTNPRRSFLEPSIRILRLVGKMIPRPVSSFGKVRVGLGKSCTQTYLIPFQITDLPRTMEAHGASMAAQNSSPTQQL